MSDISYLDLVIHYCIDKHWNLKGDIRGHFSVTMHFNIYHRVLCDNLLTCDRVFSENLNISNCKEQTIGVCSPPGAGRRTSGSSCRSSGSGQHTGLRRRLPGPGPRLTGAIPA